MKDTINGRNLVTILKDGVNYLPFTYISDEDRNEVLKSIDELSACIEENQRLRNKLQLNTDCEVCRQYPDNKLDKAKELIKNIIRVTWNSGWSYSLDWKVKAETFLSEE